MIALVLPLDFGGRKGGRGHFFYFFLHISFISLFSEPASRHEEPTRPLTAMEDSHGAHLWEKKSTEVTGGAGGLLPA